MCSRTRARSVRTCVFAGTASAFAFQTILARSRWAATPVEHTTLDPAQPGVRLRCYVDMRQRLRPRPGHQAVPALRSRYVAAHLRPG
ncbi:DUF6207 family protein [Streptomyces sp. NPDC096934]|uniref:DUF6207 family protein n=1 Tax=Streptomyces sp. NPDC096934 TaxID=3155551 RepID=UPI0033210737